MSETIFLSVFEASLQVSLIVLILIVFAPLLNIRYAAKWKYFVWIALALRLIVPFQINLPFHKLVINMPAEMTAPITANTAAAVPIILQPGASGTPITLLDVGAVLWLIGGLLFLSIHLFSCLHFKKRIMKEGLLVNDPCILSQMSGLLTELQIKGVVPLMRYSGAGSPMIIGFFRPILVLPDTEYSQEELFFILKHELIHWKRHDIYCKLLFVTANALHWFNPIIYMMRKEAAADMELSCDERVIQGTSHDVRKAYTETLLSALHKQCKKTTSLTTQFNGGTRMMKKRFKNILDKSKKRLGLPIFMGILCLTLFLGIMTGCSATDSSRPEPTSQTTEPETDGNTEDEVLSDSLEIKDFVEEFASAYFSGDDNAVRNYLTSSYEWEISTYEGTGEVSNLTFKGLDTAENLSAGDICVVSIEYKDSPEADTFHYLTLELIKQSDGWKIQFYGTEG